jgi:hypothetical protein
MCFEGLLMPDAQQEGPHDVQQVPPKEKQHGQHSTQLDNDIECKGPVAYGYTQERLSDEQVGGGRDGDKFGQSLDDAEHDSLKIIHSISS